MRFTPHLHKKMCDTWTQCVTQIRFSMHNSWTHLHVTILNAVVHHLDEVAAATVTNVHHAWTIIDLHGENTA